MSFADLSYFSKKQYCNGFQFFYNIKNLINKQLWK